MFECGEELTKKQKRWIQICQANLQVEARQEAHRLSEEERTDEQKQMVARDGANLQVKVRQEAHKLAEEERTYIISYWKFFQ
jgi:hypothetical protein